MGSRNTTKRVSQSKDFNMYMVETFKDFLFLLYIRNLLEVRLHLLRNLAEQYIM